MTTEEEAKTRWCPFTRLAADEREWHTNRPSHAEVADKNFDRCIGSACMAWRSRDQWRFRGDVAWRTGGDDGGGDVQERTVGYCGLAGAPQ